MESKKLNNIIFITIMSKSEDLNKMFKLNFIYENKR